MALEPESRSMIEHQARIRELLKTKPQGAHISEIAGMLNLSHDYTQQIMRADGGIRNIGVSVLSRWYLPEHESTAKAYQAQRATERRKRHNAAKAKRRREITAAKRAGLPPPEPKRKVRVQKRPAASVWEFASMGAE